MFENSLFEDAHPSSKSTIPLSTKEWNNETNALVENNMILHKINNF
tara:strand:- start:621 stop:758 length:138 start_codon:yes stop_codon:yes gene_type:complete